MVCGVVPSTKHEAIKTLSKQIGIREAARQMGLPEWRVLKWSQRDPDGPWSVIKSTPLVGAKPRPVLNVLKPSEAHDNVMIERKADSAIHLSKYIVDASNNLAKSNGKLKNARVARDIVAARSGIWPEERQGETGLTLNLLNLVIPAESARRSAHEDE